MPTAIFVHGACVRDATWWWSRMVKPLAARGLASAAVELPSCGDDPGRLGDMYADVQATRAAIERSEPPVLLCGHSYGGAVITEAGTHDAVAQLVYIVAVMPDESQSLGSFAGPQPAPWMDPGDDGTVGVHAEPVRELFLQDCDGEAVAGALARLTRQSAVSFTQAPRLVGWREKPSTYVVCLEDLAIPAAVQRERAGRASSVVELATGHHPFLARPELLAETLAGVAPL